MRRPETDERTAFDGPHARDHRGGLSPAPPPRPGDRPRRSPVGAAARRLARGPPRVPVRAGRTVAAPRPLPRLERRPVRAEGAAAPRRRTGVRGAPPPREPPPADGGGRGRRRSTRPRQRDPRDEVPAALPPIPAADDAV